MEDLARQITSTPFVLSLKPEAGVQQPFRLPRSGELCPACQDAKLDYDSMLNLTCSRCGYIAGSGCYT
jgi:hypothetical protein